MKLLTLIALKRSIKKWERIVEGTGVDRGADNCALCKRFLKNTEKPCLNGQEQCPVYKRAGLYGCCNTPYTDWQLLFSPSDDMRAVHDPHTEFAAKEELNFLKSLLPEKKK